MHESFEQFRKLLEPWLPGYDRVSVSALGVKKGDKQYLLSARLHLLSPLQQSFQRPPLNDIVFWGQTEEIPFVAADFADLLERLAAGAIKLGNLEGELPKDSQANSLSPWFYSGHAPRAPVEHEEPRTPLFRVTGGSSGTLLYSTISLQEVEWHLHSHKPPFVSLDDLYRHLRLPQNVSGDATLIEVIAAPPMMMSRDSTIENGRIRVCIQAARGLAREKISIGYVTQATDEIKRGNIDAIRWVEKEKTVEGVAEMELGDCSTADCFLTYWGTGMQHLRLVEAKRRLNARAAIQEAFDPELKKLRPLLFEVKRDDVKRFEDGVAILFGMLGFSISQHGRATKLSEAPDIVAITRSGNVAVVECTTDLPDKGDQVATAVKRAEQARRALDDTGWAKIEVLPIVVTMLSEREIVGQKSDAEAKGVMILCADDIQKALDLIKYPIDADELFVKWVNYLRKPQFLRNELFG